MTSPPPGKLALTGSAKIRRKTVPRGAVWQDVLMARREQSTGVVLGAVLALLGGIIGAGGTLAATALQSGDENERLQLTLQEERAEQLRERREAVYAEYVGATGTFYAAASAAQFAIAAGDAISTKLKQEKASAMTTEFLALEQLSIRVDLVGSDEASQLATKQIESGRLIARAINDALLDEQPVSLAEKALSDFREPSTRFLEAAREDLGTSG